MSELIRFEKSDGIATITLNRPEVRNALTWSMCADLTRFIGALNDAPEIRLLHITGAGANFCAGADLRGIADVTELAPTDRMAEMGAQVVRVSHTLFTALHQVNAPVIMSLRGYAIGAGMQFVLGSDLVVASETAKIAAPLAKLGHTPDHGESWYLPRKVGAARAMQILLLGEFISAAEAERFGLVNWVTPDDALEARTEAIIATILAGAPKAVLGMKSLLRQSETNTLQSQFAAELASLTQCAGTRDFVEAITAAREKRKPVFQGH